MQLTSMLNGRKFLFTRHQALSTLPAAESISFYALAHNLKALYSVGQKSSENYHF